MLKASPPVGPPRILVAILATLVAAQPLMAGRGRAKHRRIHWEEQVCLCTANGKIVIPMGINSIVLMTMVNDIELSVNSSTDY